MLVRPVLFVLFFLFIGPAFPFSLSVSLADEGTDNDRNPPSVRAAMNCIAQLRPIVRNRQAKGADVYCRLPVNLSEHDLDELFRAALRSSKMSDKMRHRAEKYSSLMMKTLTNFRAADCQIRLHIPRAAILSALSQERVTLQMADQPADCIVTTKKYKKQKLHFSFAPKIKMKQGCVNDFALNMGKIDAGCRICYFNRLYLSTKLVSVWANHMSHNVKRALNIQLGGACQ